MGWSQAQVALAMGTTQSAISRLENQPDMLLSTLHQYVAAVGATLQLVVTYGEESQVLTVPDSTVRGHGTEFKVIWQDLATRSLHQIGWLVVTGGRTSFCYTEEARRLPNFRPLPVFPDFDREYKSSGLLPYFAGRLPPDLREAIGSSELPPSERLPTELLAIAGEDVHEIVQIVPAPTERPDGTILHRALVSGVRHANDEDPDTTEQALARVAPGDQLMLRPEPDNPKDPLAVMVHSPQGQVGWVPRYLAPELHDHWERGGQVTATVARLGDPGSDWHVRVLIDLALAPAPAN